MSSFLSSKALAIPVIVAATVGVAPSFAIVIDDAISLSARTTVPAKSFGNLTLPCKTDYSLIAQAVTPGRPGSMLLLGQQPVLIDGTVPVAAGVYPEPIGVKVTAYNNFDAAQTLDVQVLCAKFGSQYSGSISVGVINVMPKQFARGVANCPPDYFAVGGGYYGPNIATTGSYPHWKSGLALFQRANGQHEAADAWAVDVANPGTTDQLQGTYAYCRKLPALELETHVTTVLLEPMEQRFVGVSMSDALAILSGGVASGPEGFHQGDAVWRTAKLSVQRGFNFNTPADEYVPSTGGIWGSFVLDRRPKSLAKVGSPVTLGVIAAPTQGAARPVSIVPAVEYYNAPRDHYFITSIPKEVSDLDSGVHPGWQRTGQTFNVYAAGSGGPLGRLPVCRYYGLPAAGLDSHFYTGSVRECLDVGAKFAGAWQIESGEVFQVHLPNIVTGECPAGTLAVLRTWNKRADSNHRYMTSLAIQAQMLAQGHVAEGYGPNGVGFCVPT